MSASASAIGSPTNTVVNVKRIAESYVKMTIFSYWAIFKAFHNKIICHMRNNFIRINPPSFLQSSIKKRKKKSLLLGNARRWTLVISNNFVFSFIRVSIQQYLMLFFVRFNHWNTHRPNLGYLLQEFHICFLKFSFEFFPQML